MPLFGVQVDGRDARTRILLLDLARQLQSGLARPLAGCIDKMSVEQFIKLVIPRDDRTCDPAHEQECRDRQSSPAVKQRECKSHGVLARLRLDYDSSR